MNSYFANPSLSCHLSGGQDVLPNVPLNSTTYDTVRHFSSYGAAVTQNRIYAPFYSPQDNVVFGSGRAQYEYGSNVFLQDKDVLPSCRQTNMGLNTQSHIAQEYSLDQGRAAAAAAAQEQKSNIPIYPWMQRMNSHSGEFLFLFYYKTNKLRKWASFTICLSKRVSYFLWPPIKHDCIPPPLSSTWAFCMYKQTAFISQTDTEVVIRGDI